MIEDCYFQQMTTKKDYVELQNHDIDGELGKMDLEG